MRLIITCVEVTHVKMVAPAQISVVTTPVTVPQAIQAMTVEILITVWMHCVLQEHVL